MIHRLAVSGLLVFAAALPRAGVGQPQPSPGRTLFQLDLSQTPVGDFPTSLKMLKGIMEVVVKNGVPMLKASAESEFVIQLPPGQVLPPDFTLEFDLIPKLGSNPQDLSFEGTPTINQGSASAHVLWHATGYLAVIGGGGDNYETPMPEEFRAKLPGVLTHVVVEVQGERLKLSTNGRQLFALQKQFARGRVLRVFLGGQNAGTEAVFLARLRVVAGTGLGIVAAGAGAGAGGGDAGSAGAGAGGGGSASGRALAGASESGSRLGPEASLNDAPAPTVQVSPLPAGFELTWSALDKVASYSVCRESPPGSQCVPVNLVNDGYYGGAAPHYAGEDLGLYPGTTHAYRVTATRSDGHYGQSAPVSGTTGEIPPPTDLEIIQDNSTSGHLVLGWKPGWIKGFRWKPIADHQVVGTGMTTAQMVAGTQLDVTLSPGVTSHEWKVYSMVPDQKGGWFASPVPATIKYESAPAGGAPSSSNTTKYRLVALGFKVTLQTNDDPLAGDGAGDEVYLGAVVNTTTRNLDLTNLTTLTSATYGDIGASGAGSSGRIAAGTASPSGGLKTGDGYPGKIDPAMAATGTPTRRTFPLLLWEGGLDDAGMIVVHPTLWEEDAGKSAPTNWFNRIISAAHTGYTKTGTMWKGGSQATILRLRDQEELGPPLLGMAGPTTVFCDYWWSTPVGGETNRCDHQDDRPLGLLMDDQSTSTSQLVYHDQMLVLTRAAIERVLSLPGPRPGVPPGVIVMKLVDPGTHAVGSYELYFKVERMP